MPKNIIWRNFEIIDLYENTKPGKNFPGSVYFTCLLNILQQKCFFETGVIRPVVSGLISPLKILISPFPQQP